MRLTKPVCSQSKILVRDWVTNVSTTHYLVGSAIGPHPFPLIVREFQSVIGIETRQEFLRMTGGLPTAVVACVGGGSNAIGMFHAFVPDSDVRLIGVEAGGDGVDTERHRCLLIYLTYQCDVIARTSRYSSRNKNVSSSV